MHKKDDKDAQLDTEANDHAISKFVVGVALTWFNAYNEHTYATSNQRGEYCEFSEKLQTLDFNCCLCLIVLHSFSLFF